MASNPADILGVTRPDPGPPKTWSCFRTWHTRFMTDEILPRYDEFEKPRCSIAKAGKSRRERPAMRLDARRVSAARAALTRTRPRSSKRSAMSASTASASRCTTPSSHPTSCITDRKSRKQKWLPKMATGELIGAIAMTEPGAGSDLQGVKTSAKKDGNHYVINGSKTFITNGQLANLIIVVTKTDPAGRQGYLADGGGDRRGRGVPSAAAISTRSGSSRNDTSELFFDDVRVFRPQTCSARKKARASCPADERTAAGTVADCQPARSR
jgi:acyl-CoA dehydrogenase